MQLEIYGVSVVFLIIGLVQLAKNLGLNSKYGGVVAVILGVATSVGYSFFGELEVFKAVIIGLAIGLSAAGFYSTQKNVRGK